MITLFLFIFSWRYPFYFLEGEKKTEKKLTLKELADMAKGVFTDCFVHFSSCRTLLGSDKELEEFKMIQELYTYPDIQQRWIVF